MKRARHLTVAALLVLAAPQMALAGDCGGEPIPVKFLANGDIFWNGRHIAIADLDRKIEEAASHKPMSNVRLLPDKGAKYETVALFVERAQHFGLHCLGFVGIESGN